MNNMPAAARRGADMTSVRLLLRSCSLQAAEGLDRDAALQRQKRIDGIESPERLSSVTYVVAMPAVVDDCDGAAPQRVMKFTHRVHLTPLPEIDLLHAHNDAPDDTGGLTRSL